MSNHEVVFFLEGVGQEVKQSLVKMELVQCFDRSEIKPQASCFLLQAFVVVANLLVAGPAWKARTALQADQ
jgi:hypothetical protein